MKRRKERLGRDWKEKLEEMKMRMEEKGYISLRTRTLQYHTLYLFILIACHPVGCALSHTLTLSHSLASLLLASAKALEEFVSENHTSTLSRLIHLPNPFVIINIIIIINMPPQSMSSIPLRLMQWLSDGKDDTAFLQIRLRHERSIVDHDKPSRRLSPVRRLMEHKAFARSLDQAYHLV